MLLLSVADLANYANCANEKSNLNTCFLVIQASAAKYS
jgi:hypothetical protein